MNKYVVTGANRGLGLEFVRQLSDRGEQVLAACRAPKEAEALNALASSSERITVAALDVSDEESVRDFIGQVARQGGVDVLINNAGIYPEAGSLGELDYEAFHRGFEVNAIAPLRLAEAILPHLSGPKTIVNVTSQMGSIEDNSSGGSYAYRMSKAALNMGIKSFAIDTAERGVKSLLLHPGWVQTDMGGPNATITPERSIKAMLKVIDGADASYNGKFYGWRGDVIPW